MNPTWHIHEKSSEDMSEVPDNSVQLILTSPSEMTLEDIDDADHITLCKKHTSMCERIFRECRRVLKDSGVFILNVGHPSVADGSFDRALTENHVKVLIARAKYPYRLVENVEASGLHLISDAMSVRASNLGIVLDDIERHFTFSNAHEHYFTFCKKKPVWYGRNTGNVFEDSMPSSRHTMFNTEIVVGIIKVYTRVGDTVLDPFAGSCVIVPFSYRLGRNSIAYELDSLNTAEPTRT